MKLLALETSTKNFSLAVARDGKIISKNIVLDKILSDSIMQHIDAILKKAKLSFNQLDGFAVGLGPGSFTSLRVGLATVKALALATQKPVVGVSSLDVLAMSVPPVKGTICALVDARRNLVYSCLYTKKDSSSRPLAQDSPARLTGVPGRSAPRASKFKRNGKYLLTPLEDVLTGFTGDVYFVGDAVALYGSRIRQLAKGRFIPHFAGDETQYPQAASLVMLALERFFQKRIDDIATLVPIYLYPSDCQVRQESRQ
jgi:tRNA threonylcarbamoyladenosine biosynthesis protein TsaB